ncbi:MAG: tetratricopeptide repeat protein [Coleofasciculaceae cyanobacterium SM2_1_6]|nr:tetratricopeptide repeat protein [Coleofasciculaceae cyanobacterium SM2_1_6]
MATFQAPNPVDIYEKGLMLFNHERYEEAIAAFEEAINLKPKVAIAWISRGVALERLKLHNEALASHEQAIQLEPDNFLAWYNKGVQLQELGRYQEAIVAHEHALKLQPNDIDTLYNLGVELEKVANYSQALDAYDRVLRQDATDSYTLNRRGVVLSALGRNQEAIEALDRALQHQPKLAEAWTNRGLALCTVGKYPEAVISFDQALSLNPGDRTALENQRLAQSKLISNPVPTTPKAPTLKTPTASTIKVPSPQAGVIIGANPAAPGTPVKVLPSIATPSTPAPVAISTNDPLIIAGRTFTSRLMTGTGKYRSIEETQQSIAASGCQIVTVAVRRVQANTDWQQGLAQALDWSKLWMLPNTAGCQTAEEAVRVARLGREMAKLMGQEDNNFVKLEVIPDAKYLLPDPVGTLEAAEILVNEGFAVLPYINADPILAERLQAMGCATLMPLGSPIGSGQGIKNAENIAIIIENAVVPVVIDAGIGTPSEAAQGMELGADALLVNTAIAQAQNPVQMAQAMAMATIAGRLGYLAGRIPVRSQAQASSPLSGVVK